jgi:hypothetical protein
MRPTWYELGYDTFLSSFLRQFEVVDSNVTLLSTFEMALMEDGETATVEATVGFFDFLSTGLELAPASESTTARKLTTLDRFQVMESETAEIRRLVMAVTEQLSCHQVITSQMFARQAELIDAGINRSRENQLEIRGFRMQISTASSPEDRHRAHQQQVHDLLQILLPKLEFKVHITLLRIPFYFAFF